MKQLKKILAGSLAALALLSLTACGGEKAPAAPAAPAEPAPAETTGETYRVAVLKGPTAMGFAQLMDSTDSGEALVNDYEFSVFGAVDEVTPALVQGEMDMACVPANLASVLYNKTKGGIVTLAVDTLGILYMVEMGDEVQSIADLKGKTLAAAGKGATPEYVLRYLLTQNGLDPDADVIIDWKSEHSECVAALAAGTATIALLPQPFVTAAQSKLPEARTALDLTQEWEALDNGSGLLTGVIVARKEIAEANPAAVDAFLQEYAASAEWGNANVPEAAALIGQYGIVDAAVAEKALPSCNIVCVAGSEMKEKLSGYLQVLFDAAPESVGGALPGDDFYYGA